MASITRFCEASAAVRQKVLLQLSIIINVSVLWL